MSRILFKIKFLYVLYGKTFLQMLAGLFERCMKRRGVKESDPYDWEKLSSIEINATNTQVTNTPAIITRPATRITDNMLDDNLMCTFDNNQENIEPDNRRELEVELQNGAISPRSCSVNLLIY